MTGRPILKWVGLLPPHTPRSLRRREVGFARFRRAWDVVLVLGEIDR
jgi:hypothetical protein